MAADCSFSGRIRRRKGAVILCAALSACAFIFVLRADAEDDKQQREYEIKANNMYYAFKLIQWDNEIPEATTEPWNLCILGKNPFGNALNSLAGKTVRGKKISVRYIAEPGDAVCRAVFISSSEKGRIRKIVKTLEGAYVLTIGDTRGFAQDGVMINFYPIGNEIRFEINEHAAYRSGLEISSKLLDVATISRTQQ